MYLGIQHSIGLYNVHNFNSISRNILLVLLYTFGNQGPVIQSIVSLTSSLRGQLVKFFYHLTKYTEFFVEKM